jgi:hypothetical protein
MKGQLSIDSIGPTALSIGVGIIIVAVVSLVLATMIPATYDENHLYSNYSFTANDTNLPTIDHGDVSILAVYNNTEQTGMAGVLDTDWHYYANNNTLHLISADFKDNTAHPYKSVQYTYTAYTNATSIVDEGLTALTSFADWFGIIVIVVVAVIILSLVMLLRGRGGEG